MSRYMARSRRAALALACPWIMFHNRCISAALAIMFMASSGSTMATAASDVRVNPAAKAKGSGRPLGGAQADALANRLSVNYVLHNGPMREGGPVLESLASHGVELAYLRRLGRFHLGGTVGYGRSEYRVGTATLTHEVEQPPPFNSYDIHEINLLAVGEIRFPLSRLLRPVLAMDTGVVWMIRHIPFADQRLGFRLQGRGGVELRLLSRVSLMLSGHVGLLLTGLQDRWDDRSHARLRVGLTTGVAVSF